MPQDLNKRHVLVDPRNKIVYHYVPVALASHCSVNLDDGAIALREEVPYTGVTDPPPAA